MSEYFAEYAWLPDGLARSVRITIVDGRFDAIEPNVSPRGEQPLPGLVLPGLANTHSHAFHRALRGRTHGGGGTFWTWRERMYSVAEQLDPDSYLTLARATYAEMALAGVTVVGEFHYLHHAPGAQRYADPNAMGRALIQAAADAGIRITLLDTCYLAGGLAPTGPTPLDARQLRFGDGTADAWAERVAQLSDPGPHALIGSAIHSIRAVPRDQLATVVAVGGASGAIRPLHVHLSEQPAENEQCLAAYGATPARVLGDAGVLSPRTTAVHATHVSAEDIALLGSSRTAISMCPTTERDLADGIGPARALADAGSAIVLGSDQHAVIDLLEEARALEMDERLASHTRGRFTVAELVGALTDAGNAALGWPDAGRIERGCRGDLVAVRLDTVRTAGTDPGQAILAATASDIDTVISGGRVIVAAGRHHLGEIGPMLAAAISPLG